MDISKFMSFASNMADASDSLDTENIFEEVIDSVIYFSEFLEEKKDSISKLPEEERIILESLKNAKMQMYMDEENGKILLNFIYDFEKLNDLKGIQNKVAKAYSSSNKKKAKLLAHQIQQHIPIR